MTGHKNVSYLRRKYLASFLFGALTFSLTSEDRGNGEYKHFVYLKAFNKNLLYLCFRTGKTEDGTNVSIGDFRSGKTTIDFDESPISIEPRYGGYTTFKWHKKNLTVERLERKEKQSEP